MVKTGFGRVHPGRASSWADAEIVRPHQLFPARMPNNDPTPFIG